VEISNLSVADKIGSELSWWLQRLNLHSHLRKELLLHYLSMRLLWV